MTVLVAGSDLSDFAARLRAADLEVVETLRPTSAQIAAAAYVVVRFEHDDVAAEDDFALFTMQGKPIAVVRSELRPSDLTDLMLIHPSVQLLIDDRSLPGADTSVIVDAVNRREIEGSGVPIGSIRPMPTDPDLYDRSRFLSLNSPSMAKFLVELRVAIARMKTPRPGLPWDPAGVRGPGNTSSLAEIIHRSGEGALGKILKAPTERGSWAILPPPLLLLGESGTGKSLVSALIHQVLTHGGTSGNAKFVPQLVTVTGAGMDADNFDLLMHGAADAQFTGMTSHVGAFARAAFGTLFVDEFGEMPVTAQERFRTFFNDLIVRPIGGEPFFSFAHIVAATNRDLDYSVAAGLFKHDLLARFRARVEIPPLRSRPPDELRELVDFVAQDPNTNPLEGGRRPVTHLAPDALDALVKHEYRDGNFRELEMAVHSAIWRARRANSQSLQLAHVELRASNFRAESDERTIDVVSSDVDAIHVRSEADLHRLADRTGGVVLRDVDGTMSLRSAGVVYRLDGK